MVLADFMPPFSDAQMFQLESDMEFRCGAFGQSASFSKSGMLCNGWLLGSWGTGMYHTLLRISLPKSRPLMFFRLCVVV